MSSKRKFFRAEIAEEELEQILRRIDENLELRPHLRGAPVGTDGQTNRMVPLPQLPEIGNLSWHLHELGRHQELVFVTERNQLRTFVKRLLNMPIRLFARKQILFNRELTEALGIMVAHIETLREYAKELARLITAVSELQEHIHQLRSEQRGHWNRLEQLAESQVGQNDKLERLVVRLQQNQDELHGAIAQQEDQRKWLELVAETQKGQKRWLERVAADLQENQKRLDGLGATQEDQREWLELAAEAQKGQNRWLERVAADLQENKKRLDGLGVTQEDQRKWLQSVVETQSSYEQQLTKLVAELAHIQAGGDQRQTTIAGEIQALEHRYSALQGKVTSLAVRLEHLTASGRFVYRKGRATDNHHLRQWYDKHYAQHKTWPTSEGYAGRIWSFVLSHWPSALARRRLLDVGCGGGYFLSHIQRYFENVQGCDISELASREAVERVGIGKVVQALAEKLPYPDGYFDVVTCLGSLEHFLDIEAATREMARVTHDSGLLAILVPVQADWIEYDIQPTEVVMSVVGWKTLFGQCGLAVLAETLSDQDEALRQSSRGHALFVAAKTFPSG